MQIENSANSSIALTQDCPQSISPEWFSVEHWQKTDSVTGSSRGRYITWFVAHESQNWVLRHYYRGGLMEKFSKDAYLYTGLKQTRAFAELALLETLYEESFAVPKPIAAHIQRQGLWYRGDIIIEHIADSEDLVAKLGREAMSAQQWQTLGACIAKFHQRGVYHADLNAKNILITPEQFYLIDFDRGELRTPQKSWQQANLDRLLRSFNKEKGKLDSLHFNEQNWQDLMQGYQQG